MVNVGTVNMSTMDFIGFVPDRLKNKRNLMAKKNTTSHHEIMEVDSLAKTEDSSLVLKGSVLAFLGVLLRQAQVPSTDREILVLVEKSL